ncbi:TPA: glycerophosphodiester phosphodiesterase [Streptococcus suis]
MFYFNTLNLNQVSGGNQVKQGDFGSTFTYKLADEKNQELDVFDQKTAYVNLVLDNNIVFTTTVIVDGPTVTFNIDKAIPTGLYFLEIKIDSYIFPSDRQTIILVTAGAVAYDLKDLVPNYDTNMTISSILSDLSQKGIDITDLKTKMNAIYNNALTDHTEITTARGTHPNLRTKLDEIDNKQTQTTTQLAQKANTTYVNEEIAKAQLEGAGVDTSNFLVGSQFDGLLDKKYGIKFVIGHLTDTGVNTGVYTQKRISTPDIILANEDITVNHNFATYRISVYYFDTAGTLVANSGWLTSKFTIAKGSRFRLQIGKIVEETITTVTGPEYELVTMTGEKGLKSVVTRVNNYNELLSDLYKAKTRTIMHRGYSRIAPDNTKISFELAGQASECWGIETDVRCIADDSLWCLHDSGLDDHTTGTGDILTKTTASLEGVVYDAGVKGLETYPNQPICTFKDYLKVCRYYNKVACIELKPQKSLADIQKIYDMVKKMGMLNSCFFMSFTLEYLTELKRIDPRVLTCSLYLAADINANVLTDTNDIIGLEILSWGQDDSNISEATIEQLHEKNKFVSCWTTDTSQIKINLKWKGVDFITTNLIN